MRRGLAAVVTAFLLIGTTSTAFGAVEVEIDSQPVEFSQQSGSPFVDGNNRTQVPFRATMETFGALVTWDQQRQTGIAEKDGIRVEVPLGQRYIVKNGEKVANDTEAVMVNDRIYLPIRAVLEAFGADVDWDGNSQTVQVSRGGGRQQQLKVHFIDVGQGDSIFVDYGEFELLIDAGDRGEGKTVVEYIKPYVDGTLDLAVATHPHEDHIGGMPAVLGAYQVERIIDNGVSASTKIYQEYAGAIKAEGCEYLQTTAQKNITVMPDGKLSFRIIEMVGTYSNVNNGSLVGLLSLGQVDLLLMGDLEQEVEKNNLDRFPQAEVLKVGHHGSDTASSTGFLNAVKPEKAIISAGIANRYKHPHAEAMKRLEGAGALTYGTFRSGTIVLKTDGLTYDFNTERIITVEDAGAAA